MEVCFSENGLGRGHSKKMECDGCSRKTESSNVLEGEGHGRRHWKMPQLSEPLTTHEEKQLTTHHRVFPPAPNSPLVGLYYYVLRPHLHFCNLTLFI